MKPLELVNLLMLAFLSAVILLTPSLRGNGRLLSLYSSMGGLLLLYRRIRIPGLDFPRLFGLVYPLLYIAVIFDSLGGLIGPARSWRADDILASLDRAILGVDPALYLERFLHPAVVEFFTYVYAFYFFLPFILLWRLSKEGKSTAIPDWVCLVTIALYLNYALYFLFPAVGPRFHIDRLPPLKGVLFAGWIRDTINVLESNKLDVFPSAHVTVSLVTLYGFLRCGKRFAIPVAAVVAGIIISTVVLRYHYVADVLAGALLAGFSIAAGRLYLRLWKIGNGKEPVLRPEKEHVEELS